MRAHEAHEPARIARNATTSYAVRGLLGLSALLLTPYLFRRLGAEGFGTWSVVFTLATIFLLIQVGFSVGVVKFVAELQAQRRRRELEAVVGAGVWLMALLGGVALAIAAGEAVLLDGLAAEEHREAFRLGMIAVGAGEVLRFPCSVYGAALQGHQRYDLTNLAQGVAIVSFAAAAVTSVELGGGVLGVAIAYAATTVLEGVLYALLLRRVDPELPLLPRASSRSERGRIVRFSSFALLADSMAFVGQRMDVVFIAAIRNAAAAAPFAAAVKLQSALQALIIPFISFLMPMMSDLWARGSRAEVARRLAISTRVGLQLTLPVALGFALFAEDIVEVWLGPDAPETTVAIIVVLVAVQSVWALATPAHKMLVGIGRVRLVGLLAVVEGLLNVALSVSLIFAYGAVGAAFGTLFSSALLGPIKLPIACRSIGASTGGLLARSVVPALVSSLPGAGAMLAVRLLLPAGGWRLALGLGLGILLSAGVGTLQVGPRRVLSLLAAAGWRKPITPIEPVSELPSDLTASSVRQST
jgi:O-antigen/teichoic acid export membrane protein